MNVKRATAAALATLIAAIMAACAPTPTEADKTACAAYAETHNTYLEWLDTNRLTASNDELTDHFGKAFEQTQTARKIADTQEIRDAMIEAEQALQAVNEPRFFLTGAKVAQACENAGAPITLME